MNNIDCFRILDSKGNLSKIGTVSCNDDLNEVIAETIWDLCNWSCWLDDRDSDPKEITKSGVKYTRTEKDRGIVNSELVLVTEGKVMVALPVGWETFTNVQDAVNFRINAMPLIC